MTLLINEAIVLLSRLLELDIIVGRNIHNMKQADYI
jgi:hypothetical protein